MDKKETYNSLISSVTQSYLDELDTDATPEEIEFELLEKTNKAIHKHNLGPEDTSAPPNAPQKERFPNPPPKDERFKKLQVLTPYQIALILIRKHLACCISTIDSANISDYDVLAMYQFDGPNEGTYSAKEDDFRSLIRQYNKSISSRNTDEVLAALRDIAPKKKRTQDENLVAVNNGVFDYKQKVLLEFDPSWVFLTKSHVNFVDNAPKPLITNPDDGTEWDPDTWMESLSDDPAIVKLLWEMIGAIIRPNVSWNKSAWLYSETGNNGKGTLCTLMRNICGEDTYASIPLKDFSNEFMLEPLIHASAIIVDENDVGTYIDQAANLKAIITNDTISINRKFKTPVVYQFHGFMVQCMNEFPRVRDRSESFYRRQLFIPLEKRFEGCERKYIKDDYLFRPEVLEYFLYKVLGEMDYYELSTPDSCVNILQEYKASNDPIREFFLYFQEHAAWSFYPNPMLYQMYQGWMKKYCPKGSSVSQNMFTRSLTPLLLEDDSLFYTDSNKHPLGDINNTPEPMLVDFDVYDWQTERGSRNQRALPPPHKLEGRYRGITRKNNNQPVNNEEKDNDNEQ